MGRIKQHFLDQGLTAKDIPLAFACVFISARVSVVFFFFFLLYVSSTTTNLNWKILSQHLFSLSLSYSLSLSLSLTLTLAQRVSFKKTDSTRCSPSRSRRPRGLPRTAFNRPRPFANRSRILERLKTTFNPSLLKCWRARADRLERR